MAGEEDPAWYNRRAPRIVRDMVVTLPMSSRISYVCGYDEGYSQALQDITDLHGAEAVRE